MEPRMSLAADRPDALALIAEARHTLLEAVLPALSGEPRIAALMVANALGIAERDLAQGAPAAAAAAYARLAADPAALVAAIRSGAHDADPAAHAALTEAARARVAASRPGALAAT
jgi:hypothetical protein